MVLRSQQRNVSHLRSIIFISKKAFGLKIDFMEISPLCILTVSLILRYDCPKKFLLHCRFPYLFEKFIGDNVYDRSVEKSGVQCNTVVSLFAHDIIVCTC